MVGSCCGVTGKPSQLGNTEAGLGRKAGVALVGYTPNPHARIALTDKCISHTQTAVLLSSTLNIKP